MLSPSLLKLCSSLISSPLTSCQVVSKPASHLAWLNTNKTGPLLWGWHLNNSIGISLMSGGEKLRGLPDISWGRKGEEARRRERQVRIKKWNVRKWIYYVRTCVSYCWLVAMTPKVWEWARFKDLIKLNKSMLMEWRVGEKIRSSRGQCKKEKDRKQVIKSDMEMGRVTENS